MGRYIAYFSMEIGISHNLPTYSGGLGVLAGDLLKSFADMSFPVVGVTLLNEKGYFVQHIENGYQNESPAQWIPSDYMVLMPNEINVTIEGRIVKVRTWKHMIRGMNGYSIPIFFLDTNIEGNNAEDRKLTSQLYAGDRKYRLSQEIVLGIGGVRMLDSLGFEIDRYHMNEGHAALLTVELLRKTHRDGFPEEKSYDLEVVKKKCVFTTHTPVAAGHDSFEMGLFYQLLANFVPQFIIQNAVHDGKFNMTMLALELSHYINGVAKRHGEVTREMFPNYRIDSITNGVHPFTWASVPFREMYDEFMPGWQSDPYNLRYALSITAERIWEAHVKAKQDLIDEVNLRTNIGFHPARFTIGFARRFTEYKRPGLILFDVGKLKEIASRVGDIQIVFAGKAHMYDGQGKEWIHRVITAAQEINKSDCKVRVVFLENYDMRLARLMVSGCDVWLNNPQRPYEASGTSGMKACMNGVPQISSLDGWWLEGHIENVTGWSIGAHPNDPGFNNDYSMQDEAVDLYNKLEKIIIPTYYSDRDKWINIMRHCIAINGSFFNTYRMAQQYIINAYERE